jgi:hypothetical protein
LDKKELAAGDSTIAEIIFKTGHYNGKVRKSTRLTTNAEKSSNLQIQAHVFKPADTVRPLMIEPMAVELDSIRPDDPGKSWKFKVAVHNVGEEKVKAHLVAGPTELFEIKIPKDIKPGKEEYIELKFDENILEQLFTKSITIELDDSAATRYTIPITKARRWGPTRHASR